MHNFVITYIFQKLLEAPLYIDNNIQMIHLEAPGSIAESLQYLSWYLAELIITVWGMDNGVLFESSLAWSV